jgi:hypothetical protein
VGGGIHRMSVKMLVQAEINSLPSPKPKNLIPCVKKPARMTSDVNWGRGSIAFNESKIIPTTKVATTSPVEMCSIIFHVLESTSRVS